MKLESVGSRMTRWARVARGVTAASISLFIAAFSHWVAGGSLPGAAGIALCFTFSVLVCTALAGRRMPRTRLATSVAASQAMYHGFFGSLGSATLPTAPTLGHVHNAAIDFGPATAHLHASNGMILAHVLAAFLTFSILAWGERSVHATAQYAWSLVRSLLPRTVDGSLVSAATALVPSRHRVNVPALRRVDHSGLRHRGPPVTSIV